MIPPSGFLDRLVGNQGGMASWVDGIYGDVSGTMTMVWRVIMEWLLTGSFFVRSDKLLNAS